MLDNVKHEMFALRVALLGMALSAAYREVYQTESDETARTLGSKLSTKLDVAERILELRRAAASQAVPGSFLSINEKRSILADVVRASLPALLDEDGCLDIEAVKALPPWIVHEFEVTETEDFALDGETKTETEVTRGIENPVTTVRRRYRIKLTDKLRALELDNVLSGDAPEVVQGEDPGVGMARRQRALAMLARLPGHGGHLAQPIDINGTVRPASSP